MLPSPLSPWLIPIGLLLASLCCLLVHALLRRARATRELERSEARYRDLFENSTEALCTVDLSGRFTSLNATAERLTGYSREEVLGRQLAEWLPPKHVAMAAEALGRKMAGEEKRSAYDIEIPTKSGEPRWFEVKSMLIKERGKTVGIQAAARDITDKKRDEQEAAVRDRQLRHAQRLESLGLLAGGIAHDFNNILVGIVGNVSLLRADEHLPARLEGPVAELEAASNRASELTRVMLDYSGKGRDETAPLDLSRLVKDTSCLLEASLPKKVQLRSDLQDDLPHVMADRAQLQQVLMNLVTNAGEAIGNRRGTISILTGESTAHRRGEKESVPCQGVWLEVTDDGEGMDAATRQQIFDPFFTTKESGHGLGLATTLGIVRSLHGTLTLSSAPEKGTTFRLLFPAVAEDGRRADAAPAEASSLGALAGATILVVDDERRVRAVAQEMLTLAGCRVLSAQDGTEGLRLFEQHVTEVDVVLLDLHMPEMMGEELFTELRDRKPGVPILLMSGALETDASEGLLRKGNAGFLAKPFVVDALHAGVARVLEGQDASPQDQESRVASRPAPRSDEESHQR